MDRLSSEARSDVKTVAKGGAIQVIGQVSQRSVSFFFGAVFVRILDEASYGLYRFATQALSIAGQIGLAGFHYAAMRWIARARAAGQPSGVKGAARVGIAGTFAASAVTATVLLFGADWIARPFGQSSADQAEVARLLRIGAPYVPLFALLQVLRYCTQGYKTMVPSVVAGNIVRPAVRFVLGVAVLIAGFQVAGAILSLFASVAIAAAVAGWYFLRMMTPEERAARPTSEIGPMVRFSFPQAGASLLGIQTLGLGIIILKSAGTNAEVGLFAIALSLQGPGNVFLGGIVNIWAPVVSDLYERGEIARLDALYKTVSRWVVTFSFPVFVALILEGDLFVRIFAGPRAPALLESGAAVVVAVLALGNFFYTATRPTGYVISMTGRPGVNLINSVVGVVLYAGLGLWLVPRHGVLAMAWIDAGVTATINSARVVQAWVLVGVQPFGRSFLKPVKASLAGGAALLAWRLVPGPETVMEIAGLCVGAVVYLGVLRFLGLDQEEKYVFDGIKKRVFKRGGSR